MTFYRKVSLSIFSLVLFASSVFAQVKKTQSMGLKASIASGKLVYTRICASCHHDDGQGVPNMNPPLVKTTYVLGAKKKLITIVLEGFNESVEINGDTYSNVMASHAYLKDKEIADVLTYVRNSFGNKAPAVTALEVKKVRATIK